MRRNCCRSFNRRILMRYCVILVTRCLHLWMVKLGQYMSSLSIYIAYFNYPGYWDGWQSEDLFQGFSVVVGEFDALPHVRWAVGALDRFYIEI